MVNYDIVPRSNRVVGGGMPSRSGICAGVALGTLIAVPLLAATPKLTPVQAAALFKAAGFPIGADKHPVNRCGQQADPRVLRSEEHTSELQSLMRISYAVFCLKK